MWSHARPRLALRDGGARGKLLHQERRRHAATKVSCALSRAEPSLPSYRPVRSTVPPATGLVSHHLFLFPTCPASCCVESGLIVIQRIKPPKWCSSLTQIKPLRYLNTVRIFLALHTTVSWGAPGQRPAKTSEKWNIPGAEKLREQRRNDATTKKAF